MSLLEAVIALVVAIGIALLSTEVQERALSRAGLAKSDFELVTVANSLISRVGADIPFAVGSTEGITEEGIIWKLTVESTGKIQKRARLFQVTAITGLSGARKNEQYGLSTLKLELTPE